METRLRRAAAAFCAAAVLLFILSGCTSAVTQGSRSLFVFQSNRWVNLHHFLRAVARGLPADGALEPAERTAWDAAIRFYAAHYAQRDLLFDSGMVAIKEALRQTPTQSGLADAAIDPELKAVLESAAPIYGKYWWRGHDAANRRWIVEVQPLVRAHGEELARRVAAAFGENWPETPVPVDLSVTAGPNGAYTTNDPTATTLASTEPSLHGLAALEMLFHEASHRWGSILRESIAKSSAARGRKVPPDLWHAVLFYNAGELTRRTLEEGGVRGYVEYAQKYDVYRHLCGDGCRERVASAWNRRLDGSATVDQALDALVVSWPAE